MEVMKVLKVFWQGWNRWNTVLEEAGNVVEELVDLRPSALTGYIDNTCEHMNMDREANVLWYDKDGELITD
jgi:hypothetical protein